MALVGVRWSGRNMGEYDLIDHDKDRAVIGRVCWKGPGGGYWTEDVDGDVVVSWAATVDDARMRHQQASEPEELVEVETRRKKCWLCNESRPLTQFAEQAGSLDGHRSICRSCASVYWEYTDVERERMSR